MTTFAPPEQGQLVQVRSRPWVVNDVKPSSLPTPAMKLPVAGPQHLLTLSSVEDDGLGEEFGEGQFDRRGRLGLRGHRQREQPGQGQQGK